MARVYLLNRDLPPEQGIWVEEQSLHHYMVSGWFEADPPPEPEPEPELNAEASAPELAPEPEAETSETPPEVPSETA